ncbi:hypothetical protein HZY83_07505 [Gemella sp. GH3]|uniref:hypothetical protein n=1 Tax=unclassified Gemella TaxID=2624949 RepID=UPI0015CFD41A|nr:MULTISPECIES: hypothetical protein [unclassified Gemella]MBF0714520.1 hypothetical protein [Gemella sp. GH3.1]NYS51472.1 hypothetical protein [Gemella sp. GH3]
MENRWTIEEDLYLYKTWEFYTATEIAKKLNKSKDDVKKRIFDLKLRRNPEGPLPIHIFLFIISILHGYTDEVFKIISVKWNMDVIYVRSCINKGKRGYLDFSKKKFIKKKKSN